MNGADAIIKCLEKEGVEIVFGYPGVAICPFYNSILDSDIRTILIRPCGQRFYPRFGKAGRMRGNFRPWGDQCDYGNRYGFC